MTKSHAEDGSIFVSSGVADTLAQLFRETVDVAGAVRATRCGSVPCGGSRERVGFAAILVAAVVAAAGTVGVGLGGVGVGLVGAGLVAAGEVGGDLLGGLAGHARGLGEFVERGSPDRADAAEVLEQALAARRADAGDGVEFAAQRGLAPAIAVEGVGEPVGLVADPREDVELGGVMR